MRRTAHDTVMSVGERRGREEERDKERERERGDMEREKCSHTYAGSQSRARSPQPYTANDCHSGRDLWHGMSLRFVYVLSSHITRDSFFDGSSIQRKGMNIYCGLKLKLVS